VGSIVAPAMAQIDAAEKRAVQVGATGVAQHDKLLVM
jgi:hypothetical protein